MSMDDIFGPTDIRRGERILPDGRYIHVNLITFGRARLSVGTGAWIYDDVW